jgi:hypothetical protein
MSPDGGDTAFPIVVAEWRRNSEGNWRPGRSGLTLAVKQFPALAEGLVSTAEQKQAAVALAAAQRLGLIEPATSNAKDKTAAERMRRYRARRNGNGGQP